MKLKGITCILLLMKLSCFSQEGLKPLSCNLNYFYGDLQHTVRERPANTQMKPSAASLELPFIEDFYYSCTSNYPDPNLWGDGSAGDSTVYVNSGYAKAPPSIGVATFDGLNKHGYPYNPTLVNFNLSFKADELTSKPINLKTVNGGPLDPLTSNVALSFYYQARGNGDLPEPNDSLIVDLYMPAAQKWRSRVWFVKGFSNSNTNDSTFKRAFIRIRDTNYFHDGFRFRIRNKATTAGNFDHWHVDYVYLNQGRDSIADTLYKDVAFSQVPGSFLRSYAAMPYQQYDPGELAQKFSVRVRNNYKDPSNIAYSYLGYDSITQICAYASGSVNINPFNPNGYATNPVMRTPPVNCAFTMSDSTDFRIKHFLSGSAIEFSKQNDTVTQFQRFRNYYAFDDESAEAGYYVKAVGSKVVVKVRLNNPDSLRAVRIYFDPIGSMATMEASYHFRINVYSEGSNGPGSLIYTDNNFVRTPKFYATGFKSIPEYTLPQPMVLPAGTYYIGVQQVVADAYLTIGYDLNNDYRTSLYFDSGNGWEQSVLQGALMMRPVFGKKIVMPVGLNEHNSDKTSFIVFPNPSSSSFSVRGPLGSGSSFQLLNALGQAVRSGSIAAGQAVSTEDLGNGIYLLIIKEQGRAVSQQKIIIQH